MAESKDDGDAFGGGLESKGDGCGGGGKKWVSGRASKARARFEDFSSIVQECVEWASSSGLEQHFEEFGVENAHLFAESAESKEDDPVHKLEYTECHENYLAMFEEQLENFLDGRMSVETFFGSCKEAMADEDSAMQDHKWFVDMILSMMEYEQFYENMVAMASRRTRK